MATIYQRGKIWWGRFQYKGHPFRKSLETSSRNRALKRLTQWESEVKSRPWGENAGKTYDDAMINFLTTHCLTLRDSSISRYKQSAVFLTGFFSGKPLSAITSSTLADYEARRRQDGVSAPTIRRDLACLSSMFTHAIVDLEWIDANPVLPFLKRQKRRGRLKESAPKTRYLSVLEEAKLLKACVTDKNGLEFKAGKSLADAIAFAIDTGLRKEEQWSLTWDQVDLAKNDIFIPKEKAKGKRDRRVPLWPRAAQILAQLARRDENGNDHIYVWVNSDGERFDRRNKGLRDSAARARIPHVSWHDLRRTCGCRLLQEHKFPLEAIRDWLGHESVQQTERAYAFLKSDALQSAVQSWAQGTGLQTGSKTDVPDK